MFPYHAVKRFWPTLMVIALSVSAAQPHGVTPDPLPREARSVVRISGIRCGSALKNHELTGFYYRWNNKVGILTALHGVVGCDEKKGIRARGIDINVDDLRIEAVDVRRDIAWLLSPSETLNSVPATAILPAAMTEGGSLRIIGFPQGLTTPHTHAVSFEPNRRRVKLGEKLPPAGAARDFLAKRKSPDLELTVLSLAGPLQPGYSGAPILNAHGVIGVANGGLREGTAHIGWAIELAAIHLENVKDTAELKQLGRKDVTTVFSVARDHAGYRVHLRIPSSMSAATVLLDGRPALILKRTATVIIIEAPEGQLNREFRVESAGRSPCILTQAITKDNTVLTPCQ